MPAVGKEGSGMRRSGGAEKSGGPSWSYSTASECEEHDKKVKRGKREEREATLTREREREREREGEGEREAQRRGWPTS
jgi:hypothetical protein